MSLEKFTVKVKNPETQTENEIAIIPHTPKTGKGKDKLKLIPENLSKMKVSDFVNIWGENAVLKVLILPRFKQLTTVFTDEAMTKSEEPYVAETDPGVIRDDYSDMFGKLSLRGETVLALTKRLNEIIEEELIEAMDVMSNAPEGSKEERDALNVAKALKEEAKELKLRIEEKKVKKAKPEDTAQPAVPQPVAA